MTDHDDLHDLLSETPCLVVDSDLELVELVTEAEALRRTSEGGAVVVMHLGRALARYGLLVAGRVRYSLRDLVTISGHRRRTVDEWVRQGVLAPVEQDRSRTRWWGYREAYAAGVIGALRRQGVALRMLTKVARLLTSDAPTAPEPIREHAKK